MLATNGKITLAILVTLALRCGLQGVRYANEIPTVALRVEALTERTVDSIVGDVYFYTTDRFAGCVRARKTICFQMRRCTTRIRK